MSSDGQKKTYVLDTNVLVHDAQCITNFQEHDVVIPLVCIEELEQFKREPSERGAGARQAVKVIENLRMQAKDKGGSLKEGVELGPGMGIFRVYSDRLNKSELGLNLNGKSAVDNLCIEITHKLIGSKQAAVLVTKDVNLRILSDGMGVPCEDYKHDKKGHSLNSLFQNGGIREVCVPGDLVSEIYTRKPGERILCPAGTDLGDMINQALILKADDGSNRSALARNLGKGRLKRLAYDKKQKVISIRARNTEQQFTLDALQDESVRVGAVLGKAGTGKTLLALAAGLSRYDSGNYAKVIVVRPTTVIGKDLGYLPGSLAEKESPFMAPIKDNLSILYDYDKPADRWAEESWKIEIEKGSLELTTPVYLRGRSLMRFYIVVDEAQNLTYHEVKTIITRIGEGTKVVFVGDPWQIDNPYLDEESNGLTTLVRRLMGKKEYVVTDFLTKGERDPTLTDDLAELL